MNGLKPQIVEKDNKDQAQNAIESRAENREVLDPNVCLIFLFCPILFVESIFDNQFQYWICASVLGKVTVKRWNPNICEQLKRCPQIKSIEVLEFPSIFISKED